MLCRFTLLLALLGSAGSAHALTLGPIETTSALYEKFAAHIPIEQGPGEDISDLQVSLASAADFERLGVERSFFLTQLQFEVTRAGGKPRISVRSPRPLSEPYIDFVINVVWRQGRMLKEYIVLLDPPGLDQALAPKSTARRPATASTKSARRADDSALRTYGPTKRNDTMWSIATRTRPSRDITIEQHMLAIKRLNPSAFINDNINLLKVGQMLTIPTASETGSLSRQAARRQVKNEVDAWQAQKPAPAQTAPTPETGQLRIVAADGDRAGGLVDTAPDAGTPTTSASTNPENTRAAEAVDRQLRSLEQVAERRLAAIRERSANQTDALRIKDQQLAELQSQVQELQQEMNQLLAANPPPRTNPAPAALANTSSLLWLGAGLALLALLVWLLRRRTAQDPAA